MRNRRRQILIRMSDDEIAIFKKRLEKSKLKQNDFSVKCLLCQPINVVEDMPELIRQLKSIGNNLNQIARAINSGQATPIQAVTDLEEGVGKLWRLLRSLKAGGR